MKLLFPITVVLLLILAAGCDPKCVKQGIQQGMYEGAVEHQRLNDYPSNTMDEPPSYQQYQDQLKERSTTE